MSSSLDLKAITEKFFAAYDGHDVDGMLALCADGAQGRYLPYGKKSDMPIRGGLEQIWRGLLEAVPDFGVEVVEMIQGEGNIVVIQALLGGAMPADVPGLVTKGKSDRIARMIRENEARFQQAMAKEFKTASQEYIFETAASAGESEVQKSQLKEWMKPVEAPVPRFLAKTGHEGMIYREPYGVALIIGPFNGPLLLLIRPALAALAAGNTCILTLSEALPETTKVLLDLVPKYFDPSAVTVVAGGKEQNTELLKLSFDFIFFTGSTFVGKIVAQAAAKNLTPVLLELGGMNPAIVDETANIPDAAKKIVWGAMAWGGQWCTSPGYAYVHESVANAFAAEAKKALVELFGNDPKSNSDYSRIINAPAVDRLASLIDPAKVIAGGKSDRDAHYLDPTLLYPVTWDDKIMEDEVFGPILPILTYKSFDEAMARMAKTGRPLAGFIK